MRRAKSIAALISKCRNALVVLRSDYESSLREKNVSEELKIDIKNILENLRSCLDYVAHDIHEKYVDGTPSNLYFPIRSTRSDLEQVVARDFRGLAQKSPDVYNILEGVQPYNDDWLGKLNRLNNNNKHEDLVEQTRTETKLVTVASKSGRGSVTWGPGTKFGSGNAVLGVPIDPKTQLPIPNTTTETTIEVWVDFKFADNGESVLPYLKMAIDKVDDLCQAIQNHL